MKKSPRTIPSLLSILALAAAATACAPMDPVAANTSSLPAPSQSTNYQWPTTQGGTSPTLDLNQVSPKVQAFMGTYTGSIVKHGFGDTTESVPFSFTMSKRANSSAGGIQAYATLDLKLPNATTGQLELAQSMYVGVDPMAYYGGNTFVLMTNAFQDGRLAGYRLAIYMVLSVKPGTNEFDPTRSQISIYDCGFSTGLACSKPASDVEFGKDIRKTP